jgi:hypothetical protein
MQTWYEKHAATVTAVMATGIVLVAVTTLMAKAIMKRPDRSMWTVLEWGSLYFACVIAPALTAWVTWIRLKRYINFVPKEVKRVLQGAAACYVLLGFYTLLFAIEALGR